MKFNLYQQYSNSGKNTEWKWRLLAENGTPLAGGEESYKKFDTMCRAIRVIFRGHKVRLNELQKEVSRVQGYRRMPIAMPDMSRQDNSATIGVL